MTDEKFKVYLDLYEKRLNDKAPTKDSDEDSWRIIFRCQVQKLEKAILEGKEYQPYTVI